VVDDEGARGSAKAISSACFRSCGDGASRSPMHGVLDLPMVFETVRARLLWVKWVFSGDRSRLPRPSSGTRRSTADVASSVGQTR